MSETRRYQSNPDVSCRPEGPDEGAILFNPDTDTVVVINPIGLLIWEALVQPRTLDDIVAYVTEHCEDVPADQVHTDVEVFLGSLQPGGFLGEGLESEV